MNSKSFREWLDDNEKDSDVIPFLDMHKKHEKIAKRKLDFGNSFKTWLKYIDDSSIVFKYSKSEKLLDFCTAWSKYID